MVLAVDAMRVHGVMSDVWVDAWVSPVMATSCDGGGGSAGSQARRIAGSQGLLGIALLSLLYTCNAYHRGSQDRRIAGSQGLLPHSASLLSCCIHVMPMIMSMVMPIIKVFHRTCMSLFFHFFPTYEPASLRTCEPASVL